MAVGQDPCGWPTCCHSSGPFGCKWRLNVGQGRTLTLHFWRIFSPCWPWRALPSSFSGHFWSEPVAGNGRRPVTDVGSRWLAGHWTIFSPFSPDVRAVWSIFMEILTGTVVHGKAAISGRLLGSAGRASASGPCQKGETIGREPIESNQRIIG